jgi:hypothetical protein
MTLLLLLRYMTDSYIYTAARSALNPWGIGGGGVRRLIITENITLDGVIDATEGWLAPAGAGDEVDQSDLEAALRELSRTLEDPDWGHTTVLQGNVVDEIQVLKAEPGRRRPPALHHRHRRSRTP